MEKTVTDFRTKHLGYEMIIYSGIAMPIRPVVDWRLVREFGDSITMLAEKNHTL